jgi:hypothetical protein
VFPSCTINAIRYLSVTLVSAEPEVQWVALRNINLLLQKRSDILQNEMRVFFCKYNDPLYVKVEKLDIMVRLAGENNVDALLSELKELVCITLRIAVWIMLADQFYICIGSRRRFCSKIHQGNWAMCHPDRFLRRTLCSCFIRTDQYARKLRRSGSCGSYEG